MKNQMNNAKTDVTTDVTTGVKTNAKTINRPRRQRDTWRSPTALRFSPTAWAKLLFLRDYGETEVGGFGITANEDLLLVTDLYLVRQTCDWAHVSFDDEAVADFFDQQVDAGLRPEQFARIWIHTHPGACPQPSATDEATFDRVFGQSDWALMFIIAQAGRSYARLRFNTGPGGDCEIPVAVAYDEPFSGSDHDAWENEYLANVTPEERARSLASGRRDSRPDTLIDAAFWNDDDLPVLPDVFDQWQEAWLEYADHDGVVRGQCELPD